MKKQQQLALSNKPKFGHLEPVQDGAWTYLPNDPEFLGNDSFVIQVEGNRYKVKLHCFVAVVAGEGGKSHNPICKGESNGFIWKISSTPDTVANLDILDTDINCGFAPLSIRA